MPLGAARDLGRDVELGDTGRMRTSHAMSRSSSTPRFANGACTSIVSKAPSRATVVRIYVNQFLEEVRRRAKAASIVDGRDLDLVQEVLGVEADFDLGEMPAPLELCLKALSAFERLVVQLLYVYELSPQEAADRLQRRRGYINVTAHRPRRSLLLCLQGKGFNSADELLSVVILERLPGQGK